MDAQPPQALECRPIGHEDPFEQIDECHRQMNSRIHPFATEKTFWVDDFLWVSLQIPLGISSNLPQKKRGSSERSTHTHTPIESSIHLGPGQLLKRPEGLEA